MAEKTEEKKKGLTVKVPKLNPWMISTVILVGVLAFVLAGGWTITGQVVSPDGLTETLTPEEAANKAITWLSSFYKGQGADLTITLVEASETENGIYQFTIKLSSAQGDTEQTFYVTRDGKLFLPQVIETEELVPEAPQIESTIGNFLVSGESVCTEDGKPIIYFFGSEGCPHCRWEHPIMEEVAAGFGDYISFHNNMDSDEDRDIFSRYSTGGIPTTVLGCKYYRQGSGERLGEEQNKKVLTALICKLTDNQPADVCAEVEDLVEQV